MLITEVGGKNFWGGTTTTHTGTGHFSLDIDDIIEGTKGPIQLSDISILAAGDGKVTQSYLSTGGFGYTVVIDHDEPYDGTGYTTRYAHLKSTPTVSNGQWITQGYPIGTMGTTGSSTGTHLHFQVYYNGSSVSSVKELQGLVIDGRKIEEYKVGTQDTWNPKYYSSTNKQSGATVVTLVSFTANAGDDGSVTLAWETATEVDNAGFNLYRSRRKNGTYTQINNALINARGNAVSGASYTYVDTPGRDGIYYYKLEDVDYYGVSTMHDPEKVRVMSGDDAAHRSRGPLR